MQLNEKCEKIISTLISMMETRGHYELCDFLYSSNLSSESFYDSYGNLCYNMIFEIDAKKFSKITINSRLNDYLKKQLNIIFDGSDIFISKVVIRPRIQYYVNLDKIASYCSKNELINKIQLLKNILLDVFQNKKTIVEVADEYQSLYSFVSIALSDLKIKHDNPYYNLGDAWKYCKATFPDYKSRRIYVSNLYDPLLKIIDNAGNQTVNILQYTGWSKINQTVYDIKKHFRTAVSVDEFNGIGAMCRHLYCDLAGEIYDTKFHVDNKSSVPSKGQYKTMFYEYFNYKLPGQDNKDFRKCSKTTTDLADTLVHKMENLNKQQVEITIVSVISLINVIAVLEGNSVID